MAPSASTNVTTRTRSGVVRANSLSRRAYVTFLAGNGDYWKGIVGLAKGLRKAHSVYPLVVAVLADVPLDHRNKLLSEGSIVREIEPVDPPENQTGFAMAHYIVNYSKLRMWEFVEYSKMIYLDGDIQVFDNIDHLFDLPDGNFYAVMDCFCEKSWSGTPQHQIGYCQLSPRKFRWPEEELGPKPPPYFNAGMFVFEPNLSTYDNLLQIVKLATATRFAEQDLLNIVFQDVYKPIPNVYNLTLLMLWRHPENVELEKTKVVHYTCAGEAKPWRVTGTEEIMDKKEVKMLVDKWWDIYNDKNLDYQQLN
ncbi:hypothetical protein L1887_16379 [Cichorium endivia]|nr:hypothetical protein L1887_16379 [Cichorium endivia]